MKGKRILFSIILVLVLVIGGFGCSEEDDSGSVSTSSNFVPDPDATSDTDPGTDPDTDPGTDPDTDPDTDATSDTDPDTGTDTSVDVPAPASAQSITFDGIDMDMDDGELYGAVAIAKATDESEVSEYRLYWGDSATGKLAGQPRITSFTADGTNQSYSFVEDSAIPASATHLLVYSAYTDSTDDIESTTPTALDIPDGVVEMVADINENGNNSSYLNNLVGMNGNLYFFAFPGSGSYRLYKSDGTTPVIVASTANTSSGDMRMIANESTNTLFFSAASGDSSNTELWQSDGTTASAFTDINPDSMMGSNPDLFTFIGNTLYFRATDGTNTGIWKTSGSTPTNVTFQNNITTMAAVGSMLYFNARTPADGIELWKSNGTGGGTDWIHDINNAGDGQIGNLVEFEGKALFTASNGTSGVELWTSDGTGSNTGGSGTEMVKDIFDNGGSSSGPKNFMEFNGELFFAANSDTNNKDLWKTDGTESGTTLVKTINTNASLFDLPQNLTVVGSTLFFTAEDVSMNKELWKTDGTSTETSMIDIKDSGGSYPAGLTAVNDYLFFIADGDSFGTELWVSDGSVSGTVRLTDINTSGSGLETSNPILLVGENLFFSADDGTNGKELWRYYVK